jgi:hypothetical protein
MPARVVRPALAIAAAAALFACGARPREPAPAVVAIAPATSATPPAIERPRPADAVEIAAGLFDLENRSWGWNDTNRDPTSILDGIARECHDAAARDAAAKPLGYYYVLVRANWNGESMEYPLRHSSLPRPMTDCIQARLSALDVHVFDGLPSSFVAYFSVR